MTNYALSPQLYYSGGYNSIAASRVFGPKGIEYTRGVTDELDLLKGQLTFRVIDDDDQYRPSNPESPLYGILGPYLPFRYQIDGVSLYSGEIEALTPGQTDDHQTVSKVTSRGVRWVDFKVSGPLQTVGRWRDVIASPMRTQITSLPTLRGYWPGEDGQDASVMSAGVSTIGPAIVTGVTFENADGPAGSNKLLTIGSAGRIDGRFPTNIGTSSWQISFTSNCAGADATERFVFGWTTSNGYNWVWSASTTTFNLTVSDEAGSVLYNASVGNGGVTPGGQAIVFRFKCTKSGANWTAEYGWYPENSPVLIGSSGSFVGTAGRPVTWLSKANTVMNGAFFGHVFATDGTSDDLQSYAMLSAVNGYPGETTAARYRRVLTGRGIPLEVLGDESKARPMGPQRPGTLKQQLQEIAASEFGLLFESPAGRGLRFALHNYLIAQANAPALTLAYPGDVGGGFTELGTTLELYNTVIAQDRSGISAVAQQKTGRYGTADPSAGGSGVIDKTITVNLNTASDVAQAASTYLAYYQQTQRFGPITLDLDQNPGLRAAAEALDIGQFIKLTGRTPEPQILMVVRRNGADQLTRHLMTFEHVPGQIFSTGLWPGTVDRRYDLATSTISATATSTANTLNITQTNIAEDWSTSTPYDLLIGGERVTVKTMSLINSVAVLDGGFELGIGSWTPTGGTLVASTAQAHSGSQSALLTVAGSPPNALIRSPGTAGTSPAAAPGQSFTASMWVRCSVGRDVLCVIDFYNGSTYLTSAFTTTTLVANTWTPISASGTAPASTTRVEYGPTMASSPANGTLLYIDDMNLIRTDGQNGRQLATVVRSVNGVVKGQAIGTEVHIADRGIWGWG